MPIGNRALCTAEHTSVKLKQKLQHVSKPLSPGVMQLGWLAGGAGRYATRDREQGGCKASCCGKGADSDQTALAADSAACCPSQMPTAPYRCSQLQPSRSRVFQWLGAGGVTALALDAQEQRWLLASAADCSLTIYDVHVRGLGCCKGSRRVAKLLCPCRPSVQQEQHRD
jgi:hypothetical protein